MFINCIGLPSPFELTVNKYGCTPCRYNDGEKAPGNDVRRTRKNYLQLKYYPTARVQYARTRRGRVQARVGRSVWWGGGGGWCANGRSDITNGIN